MTSRRRVLYFSGRFREMVAMLSVFAYRTSSIMYASQRRADVDSVFGGRSHLPIGKDLANAACQVVSASPSCSQDVSRMHGKRHFDEIKPACPEPLRALVRARFLDEPAA